MNKAPARCLLPLFFYVSPGKDVPGVEFVPTEPQEFRQRPNASDASVPNGSARYQIRGHRSHNLPHVSGNLPLPVPDGVPPHVSGNLPLPVPDGVPLIDMKEGDPCFSVIDGHQFAFSQQSYQVEESHTVMECFRGHALKVGSLAMLANESNCTFDANDIVQGTHASHQDFCSSPCCANIAGQIERDALTECVKDYPLVFSYLTCQTYHECDPRASVAWKRWKRPDTGGWLNNYALRSQDLLAEARSRFHAKAIREVHQGSVSVITAALGALSSAFVGAGVMYVVMRRGSAVSGIPAVPGVPYVRLVE